jgi:hypothetical protein
MGIAFIEPLSAGTALKVLLNPSDGAVWWRLLRLPSNAFTGPETAGAVVVLDQSTAPNVVDFSGLANGTPYFYQLYSSPDGTVGALAADGEPYSAVPAVSYQDAAADPQEVILERVRAGVAAEAAMGNIVPSVTAQPPGVIPVFSAPFALPDKTSFPCVTVHMDDTSSSSRYIGEDAGPDVIDAATGNVVSTEGWLANFNIAIVGIALNPDARIALRKAIRRIVQANLPIFDAAGMAEIGFSQSDSEQFPEAAANLYLTNGRLTFQAPAAITNSAPPIGNIDITATIGTDEING